LRNFSQAPDSLLLTHGLLPTTGQHAGRYDTSQLVTCRGE